MNEADRKEVLFQAVKVFGEKSQIRMAIEEMSELIKALCKLERAETVAERDKAFGNVIEEMADVQIMLDQLRIIFGNDAKAVEDVKLDRLVTRIAIKAARDSTSWSALIKENSYEIKEERANE